MLATLTVCPFTRSCSQFVTSSRYSSQLINLIRIIRPSGRGGNRFWRETQTALSPATCSSSYWRISRRSQARYSPSIVFWVSPGVSSQWDVPVRRPDQLTPFDAEKQWLYVELPPDDGAPHPISKAESSHPTEEAHFIRLFLGFRFLPRLITLGQGWNIDSKSDGGSRRTPSQPVRPRSIQPSLVNKTRPLTNQLLLNVLSLCVSVNISWLLNIFIGDN
ncbi:hypothetical protein CHARACLAT_009401 [Characodon lateralis]|uniref:Uncharacterized protein n=1 Tax=Characodon lateralis TaxID=208331 RepID=A0ABU7D099_9TELE|nr:hypothetical protein [Characodon lateralis]